jgi:hypothetical protein
MLLSQDICAAAYGVLVIAMWLLAAADACIYAIMYGL